MDIDRKAKISWQIAADLTPRFAAIVAAHDVPVFLHEQNARPGGVQRNSVHAVANLGGWVGDILRVESAIDRFPGLPTVVGSKTACGRDGDENPIGVAGI